MYSVVYAAGQGYSGAFIWTGSDFVLVSSVMKATEDGPWEADVKAPTEVLSECLKAGGKRMALWGTIESTRCLFFDVYWGRNPYQSTWTSSTDFFFLARHGSVGPHDLADERWALAATPVNPHRLYDQFGNVELSPEMSSFLIYGRPRRISASIERKQSIYIWLCLVLQLIALLIVCATSYGPLASLLVALESRGFLKKGDRPTLIKVIKVYVIEPVLDFVRDPRGWSVTGLRVRASYYSRVPLEQLTIVTESTMH